jgi:hypothetical protein
VVVAFFVVVFFVVVSFFVVVGFFVVLFFVVVFFVVVGFLVVVPLTARTSDSSCSTSTAFWHQRSQTFFLSFTKAS